ncbi:RnfH family protein [Moraxella marmotae]|uniref:RnfH family protein n=1 Tax=Moraxella marmotae TaxID=3344520 RepID=UPI0035F4D391
MMRIAIAYVSQTNRQYYTELELAAGSCIYDALAASGWIHEQDFAEFWAWCQTHKDDEPNHKAWYVGIFSQKKSLNTVLQDGDRVEIYRALTIDPMGKRKALSKQAAKIAKLAKVNPSV